MLLNDSFLIFGIFAIVKQSMPNISNRGKNMPASPIRKLVPFAEAAKKRGVKVYHLNIGQPDIKTPEVAWQALKNMDMEVLAYSHTAGNESYRKKLVEYYKGVGIDIEIDDLIVTTGGSEALYFSLFSCLDVGDEVIISEPFYANYNGFSNAGNIKVKAVTASIENGFALPAVSEFEAAITSKTKAILICNPSNPTGYLYTKDELYALKEITLKHDLFLIADEVYREFTYDGQQHFSILNFEGLEKHAIVIDSVSKRYSACGARIGSVVCRNSKVMETAIKFAQARLSPPSLAQVAAEAMVDVDAAYFDEVLLEYTHRRDTLVAGLREIDGVVCPNPGGAFYATVQLPIDSSDKFCQWLLEKFNHNNETIMLAPATGFYASADKGTKEVRIAYVLNETDLKRSIEILKRALVEYALL